IEARAAELGAPERRVDWRRIVPMAASNEGAPSFHPDWVYELKLDGVRAIATKVDDEALIIGRKQRETTDSYPEVARAVRALPCSHVVLDGEIVAFDEHGHPSFQRLGQRIHLRGERDVKKAMVDVPVSYLVFDLLAIGSRDLTDLPLVERKKLLSELIPAPGVMRVLDHIAGQ